MKRMTLILIACLWLPACSQQSDVSHDAPMLRLQLLLVQSASLAALPGDTTRKHAADLARRAMSGPEMNAMHHGGGANQPMMQATHDLGDAVFELLETTSQANNDINMQNQRRIQIAAQAAQLRLSGALLGADTGAFMQSQGQSLAELSPSQQDSNTADDKAVTHLLALLHKTG